MRRRPVTVVGMGADGCASLTSRAMNAIARAQLLVGGTRHLAFFPDRAAEHVVLEGGLAAALERVAALAVERDVCVLASGDPLFFGVGGLVLRAFGADNVEIIPHPSAMQLAFSRVGQKWDDAVTISLHGRPLTGLCARLRRHRKAALFTGPHNTPARVAAHLCDHGESRWQAWVCENLGGADERVRCLTLGDLANTFDVAPLNTVVLVRDDPSWRPPPVIPLRGEEAYAKRMPKLGLITKQEVRLLVLGRLALRRDSVVWDVGAGSGSVAIEAGDLCCEGRVYAVDVDPEGAAICRANVAAHGADNVQVIEGRAPEALAALEAPDAVFVGGSKGGMEAIVAASWARLHPGGRLVVNAITLENAAEAHRALRQRDPALQVTLLQVSRAVPLARYQRFEALNPIQIFAATKPATESEVSP